MTNRAVHLFSFLLLPLDKPPPSSPLTFAFFFFLLCGTIAFTILDNHELMNPMLVTGALSYFYIVKNEEISVAIENMMRDGLFILFLNHRFAYALFDKFENMTKPIPVYD